MTNIDSYPRPVLFPEDKQRHQSWWQPSLANRLQEAHTIDRQTVGTVERAYGSHASRANPTDQASRQPLLHHHRAERDYFKPAL